MISDGTGTSSFATTGGAGASPTGLSATSHDNKEAIYMCMDDPTIWMFYSIHYICLVNMGGLGIICIIYLYI